MKRLLLALILVSNLLAPATAEAVTNPVLDPACILYAVPGPYYRILEAPHHLVYGCTYTSTQIDQRNFPTATARTLRLIQGRVWAEPGSLATLTPQHFDVYWLGWERYDCINVPVEVAPGVPTPYLHLPAPYYPYPYPRPVLDLRTVCLFNFTDFNPGGFDRGERGGPTILPPPKVPCDWNSCTWVPDDSYKPAN